MKIGWYLPRGQTIYRNNVHQGWYGQDFDSGAVCSICKRLGATQLDIIQDKEYKHMQIEPGSRLSFINHYLRLSANIIPIDEIDEDYDLILTGCLPDMVRTHSNPKGEVKRLLESTRKLIYFDSDNDYDWSDHHGGFTVHLRSLLDASTRNKVAIASTLIDKDMRDRWKPAFDYVLPHCTFFVPTYPLSRIIDGATRPHDCAVIKVVPSPYCNPLDHPDFDYAVTFDPDRKPTRGQRVDPATLIDGIQVGVTLYHSGRPLNALRFTDKVYLGRLTRTPCIIPIEKFGLTFCEHWPEYPHELVQTRDNMSTKAHVADWVRNFKYKVDELREDNTLCHNLTHYLAKYNDMYYYENEVIPQVLDFLEA